MIIVLAFIGVVALIVGIPIWIFTGNFIVFMIGVAAIAAIIFLKKIYKIDVNSGDSFGRTP